MAHQTDSRMERPWELMEHLTVHRREHQKARRTEPTMGSRMECPWVDLLGTQMAALKVDPLAAQMAAHSVDPMERL